MNGKEHAKTLGILFWVYEGLQIFGLLIAALILIGMSGFMFYGISQAPQRPGDPPPELFVGVMGIIFIVVIALNVLFLIPGFVAAYGLKKEKPWAKTWIIIACCLAMLNVPFGTALAVYGLWFVLGDQGKAYFDNPNGGYNVPPAPPNSWR